MQRKQFLRYAGAALGLAPLVSLIAACGGGGGDSDIASAGTTTGKAITASAPSSSTTVVSTLSPDEIAALKFMREEEKLAHDVYVALFNVWGANVFRQIALSETTHTEAILALLTQYGLEDPAAGKAPGVFESPTLQTLYNTLIAMGQPTLIDALKVGALIEETDIHDINEKKAITNEANILQVYDSLLCGSRNHLRAFNGQLQAQGVAYVPQVITQAEWDVIANAAADTCGR